MPAILMTRLHPTHRGAERSPYHSGRSPRLAQDEERGCSCGEREAEKDWARRGGDERGSAERPEPRLIYGPKNDGTYIVEFRTADGEALAISIPGGDARVIRHFQERMPYGLFVPDVP